MVLLSGFSGSRPTGTASKKPAQQSGLFSVGLAGARLALALMGVKEALAQTNVFGRHFDQFIICDIGDRLFQAHPDRGCQADSFDGAGRADDP